MLYRHDSQDLIHIAQPEAVSPDRPPQWKWSNCGYRCGLGCEEPGDNYGDESASDDGTGQTLIGSENGRVSRALMADLGDNENFNDGQSFEDVRPSLPIDSNDERMEIFLLENGSENDHLDQPNRPSNQNDLMDSLAVDSRVADEQSMVNFVSERIEMISPGPGIGSWMENESRRRLPTEYHFHRTPLRLSPQYEHCRGSSMPHDQSTFLERWNEY